MSSNQGWRPSAGDVAPWVTITIALSCALAVGLVGAGAYELTRGGVQSVWRERVGLGWKPVLLALGMATFLGVAALPPSRMTRSMRMAVVLPVAHALALVAALVALPHLELPKLGDHAPYLEQLPVLPWFAAGLGASLVLAWLIGGRREWAHAFVMLALAFLLLFSLWLPLASVFPVRSHSWGGPTYLPTIAYLEQHPATVATLVVVPPFAIAALYTALAIRAPRVVRQLRVSIVVLLGLLALISLAARTTSHVGAFAVHDNFTHLLLAAVMLAIIATVTLSLSTWFTGWLGLRRLQRGKQRELTISDDGSDEVATLEIAGWLRGPRMWMRSFIASDGDRELRIPAGARLVTAIPKQSSAMQAGEQIIIVTRRDRLKVGGLVAREVGDSPFRQHEIFEPGPNLVVGRAEPVSTAMESMLLTAWRPSVAYLIILVVAAVPSLLGVLVDPPR